MNPNRPDFDVDAEDDDLMDLFATRREAVPAMELDLRDVLERSARLRDARSWPAASAPERARQAILRSLRDRNGAWVSGVTSFAAAACVWLSLGAYGGLVGAPGPGTTFADLPGDPLVCSERAGAIANGKGDGSISCLADPRPRAESPRKGVLLASTDLDVSDDRFVTCLPFEP